MKNTETSVGEKCDDPVFVFPENDLGSLGDAVPICTGCGSYVDECYLVDGCVWHKSCYAIWINEYNAYLDEEKNDHTN